MNPSIRVIGEGRAGGSLVRALSRCGWTRRPSLGREDSLEGAACDVDLLVIATPDDVISEVANQVRPEPTTVVAHLSGSRGIDAVLPHPRRAAIHPLVAMPDPDLGAHRLLDGAWFAIAGDPLAAEVVESLSGEWFTVSEEHRALYHAAASVASNHLVVLLAQVERLAMITGVPMEAYLDLVRATVENVAERGAEAALTGPAVRGDSATVESHVRALGLVGADEVGLYTPLAEEAGRMGGRRRSPDIEIAPD